jgi:hypothetical protein
VEVTQELIFSGMYIDAHIAPSLLHPMLHLTRHLAATVVKLFQEMGSLLILDALPTVPTRSDGCSLADITVGS